MMVEEIYFGYGKQAASLQLNQLTRHGMIAGATGTGKTITLKVLAEQLSQQGIPVFISDIKGDIASLAERNQRDDLGERLAATHYEDYQSRDFPIEIWDILGQEGIPLRMSVSEMGPILMSRLLGLNDTQTGILNVVFTVADQEGLLLIDLMDLRALLNYVGEHAKDLASHYGNISKASIGVILRSIMVLEKQGGNYFFGEPSISIEDFLRKTSKGEGIINILNAEALYRTPLMYATVLLAILSSLFENLPEVGDLDQAKLVFFFDEAHLLFDKVPSVLLDQIELTVRLIRSKGVGVFFVTQNPLDIPDIVASQLGNRIQHGLRAFTPKELMTVKAVADSFRQEEGSDLDQAIQSLQTGQALVSSLDHSGTPSMADLVTIYPPMSKIGTIDPQVKLSIVNQSELLDKYGQAVNRESAHEQLEALTKESQEDLLQAGETVQEVDSTSDRKRIKELEAELAKQIKQNRTSSRRSDSEFDRFTKNMMSSVGREVGRMITRGITGMFKK